MSPVSFERLRQFAMDPAHGWDIGRFGAIGEFVRDEDEPTSIVLAAGRLDVVTPRGGLRIDPRIELTAVAWDSLSRDGETWGQSVAFCIPRPQVEPGGGIAALGPDVDAIRPEDREDLLFDLGVGAGCVSMALRTKDEGLVEALGLAEGRPFTAAADVMREVLRAQPHRVLRSPAGRIEIYQPIPPPDGKSPMGPHTHLLPKLLAKNRLHAATTPLPDGLQSALTLHPRSPWRDNRGERRPFDPAADADFLALLAEHGLAEDAAARERVRAAVQGGELPHHAAWPDTRRGRAAARILLRRLAVAGDSRAAAWRAAYDNAPLEPEDEEDD